MGKSYVEYLPFDNSVKQQLHVLIQLILDCKIDCSRIVLFGSYARVEQTAHSDLDILVLTSNEIPREVRGSLCSKFDELNADLIFYQEDIFKNSDKLLVKLIKREGVLLWKS